MSANRNSQGYDPFEPGHSTPEFEQFARESARANKGSSRRQVPNSGNRPRGGSRTSNVGAQSVPAGGRAHPSHRHDSAVCQAAAPRRAGRSAFLITLVVVLSLCIEIFGFNLAFFTSSFYPDTGSYLVDGSDPASVGELYVDAENNAFEITGLDASVKSIHFSPVLQDAAASAATDGTVQVVMYLQDEGNANYYALPAVTVDPDRAASSYISLEPAGNCHAIRVTFTNLDSIGPLVIDDISLNAHVPFDFDARRLAGILVILALLAALRPQSVLYATMVDLRQDRQKAVIAGLVAVQIAAVFLLVLSNSHYTSMTFTPAVENQFQYQKLAEALAEGHLYLNDVPSDALMAMDNPYDTNARIAQGVPYLWDHAYYEGRYYVYFGVLPCLVFFLPYYLATGAHFATWLAVALCTAVYAAGLAYLLRKACIRWFPRTSLGAFIVLDVMLFVAGGGLILCRTPSMYFLPEAMGLACVSWGLALWVRGTSCGTIERRFVVPGSLLIACTLACRPQMVLCAVFGLLLFWPFLRDARRSPGGSKRIVREFLIALAPFIAVGVLVCLYNFLRFGSPLDFGANYNLTTNDMTHRGFHVERIPFGLYAYLFQPPNLGSQFPFLNQTYMDPAYQGVTIYEPMFGGYFFLYPMTLVLLAIPLAKRGLQEKGLFVPVLVAIAMAVVLCIFDLQGAGILMRYICDFGIYFALAAAAVFLELLQVRTERPLTEGWTTNLMGGQHAASFDRGTSVRTVSVYRLTLYFLYISLVVMAVVAVLLWDAFGMY